VTSGTKASESVSALARAYLAQAGAAPLEALEREFDGLLRRIGRFTPISSETRMLEVGVGTGWFEVACAMRGLTCVGLERLPEFAAFARELGRKHGFELEIEEGSVDATPLGDQVYDVVIATSVFEHVRDWEGGLENIYQALKRGGVFYFYSTNRFSLRSGEYPGLPLYGWLPDKLRYLARRFREIGFSEVLDRTELVRGPEDLIVPTARKVAVSKAAQLPLVRTLARTFASGNTFVCVK